MSADISRDVDQLLEVVVYREMIRRGYQVTIGRVKTQEVDFSERGIKHRYIPDFLVEGHAECKMENGKWKMENVKCKMRAEPSGLIWGRFCTILWIIY